MRRATTVERKSGAKISLDNFALPMHNDSVITRNIRKAAQERLEHDWEQIRQLQERMARLSTAYNSYIDLQRQLIEHTESVENLLGFLGADSLGFEPAEEEIDAQARRMKLRENLELWVAVEQFLRFVPEAKVGDILEFFSGAGIRASRQSIEAAIKAHPKVFRVMRQKREKFVALKKPE